MKRAGKSPGEDFEAFIAAPAEGRKRQDDKKHRRMRPLCCGEGESCVASTELVWRAYLPTMRFAIEVGSQLFRFSCELCTKLRVEASDDPIQVSQGPAQSGGRRR